MSYLIVNDNNNQFMSDSSSRPYRHVSNTVVPTTTATSLVWGGALCDIENTIYRDMTYTTLTITYYTTNSDPGHMSRTTALTRASTSDTEYYTRSSTSNTIYYTRSSTSGTGYLTRSSTSYTSYGTRASTSTTGYLTRSSTSDTSYGTRSSTYATEYYTRVSTSGTSYGTAETTKPAAYTHIYYEVRTENYDIYSITNSVLMQVTSTNITTYNYLDGNTAYSYSLYGSFTSSLTSIYNDMRTTTRINTGIHYNAGSWDMRNIVYNNSDSDWRYTVTNDITSMTNYTNQIFRINSIRELTNISSNTYKSVGMYQTLDMNTREVVTTGTTYLTRSSTSDESYITRASTSGTTYYTRKSTSATTYGTRASTSGTTYYTRKSTSGTTYATRRSTYATSYETRSSTSATSYYTRSSTSAYSGISSSTLTTID